MNVDISSINRQQSSLLSHKPAGINSEAHQKEQNNQEAQLAHPTKTKDTLDKMIGKLNKLIEPHQTSLHFVLYDKLHTYYVQIVDDETKKVVKEIPSKKFLDMYASMAEMYGLIVDKKG